MFEWHLSLQAPIWRRFAQRDGITWKKHASNPIVKPGPATWDSFATVHGYVMKRGQRYDMWYSGGNRSYLRIGHAISSDGIHWAKSPLEKQIIDVGPPGSWDGLRLFPAFVVGPDHLGRFKMWYGAEDRPDVAKIAFAIATDETTWTKHHSPLMDGGNPGSWDELFVSSPKVKIRDGMYEMWFTGYGRRPGGGGALYRIGYATSPDGIQWTKSPENPVLAQGPQGSWVSLKPDMLFPRWAQRFRCHPPS